jgi:hypothetical protein
VLFGLFWVVTGAAGDVLAIFYVYVIRDYFLGQTFFVKIDVGAEFL